MEKKKFKLSDLSNPITTFFSEDNDFFSCGLKQAEITYPDYNDWYKIDFNAEAYVSTKSSEAIKCEQRLLFVSKNKFFYNFLNLMYNNGFLLYNCRYINLFNRTCFLVKEV